MNVKQRQFPNNLKLEKNTADNKNNSSVSSDISGTIPGNGNKPKNDRKLRKLEMKQLNTLLRNLVNQHTTELTEVVATNTRFISIIAHDLRSPFTSILGALELLKEKLDQYHIIDVDYYIDIAFDSANSTLNLLDNLLAWTVTQNKENRFNPVKINLNELITEEIGSINVFSKHKQITLSYSIAPDLNITADIQMVKTIFRNLISNAVKFTDIGGEITVNASEYGQFVEIIVSDTGTGISDDVLKNIFKKNTFHTKAGTNNEKGTGLGLLLCKEFVELHGGSILIESEPEKGSKFKFTLPHYI